MKKKTRRITVDSHDYHWRVATQSPGMVQLRIWRAPDTTLWAIIHDIRFDDPFLFLDELIRCNPAEAEDRFQLNPVTPGAVAALIRKTPDAGGHFRPGNTGELTPHLSVQQP